MQNESRVKSYARTTSEPPASGSITETEPARQLFRLNIDFRNVNAATRNDTTCIVCQWDKNQLNLKEVTAKSVLLTTALRRNSPLHKEA